MFSRGIIDIFKVSSFKILQQLTKKALTNRMFFGTSIWRGFGEGFGRVLGGQNHQFSHFFRCFFEAKFEARFRSAKNRPKRPNKAQKAQTWLGATVVPPLLGRDYREGYQEHVGTAFLNRTCRIDLEHIWNNLARRAHLRWAAD